MGHCGVYRVLDDEAVKARLGRFDTADCERLWRDSAMPTCTRNCWR